VIRAAGSTHKKIAMYGRRVATLLSFYFIAAYVAGSNWEEVKHIGGVACCKKTQGKWRFHTLRGGLRQNKRAHLRLNDEKHALPEKFKEHFSLCIEGFKRTVALLNL
jgi:hypothetical protein